MKNRFLNILLVAFLPLIIVVVILVVVVFSVVSIILIINDRLWLRRFKLRNAGRSYFIWSRRRGWAPLIENNVLPAVPENVETILIDELPGCDVGRAVQLCNRSVPRPCLVFVTSADVTTHTLNDTLRPYHRHGAVDIELRMKLKEILSGKITGRN